MTRLVTLGLLALLASCTMPQRPEARNGILDLTRWDWSQGSVEVAGEWVFEGKPRRVPDRWMGTEGGGQDGRGAGTYRVTLVFPPGSPPLALRYTTASTAFSVRADGQELVRVGNPSVIPEAAVPAYAPGMAALHRVSSLQLEFFVSNHEYRVGGLWRAPEVGPLRVVEAGRWGAEAQALALAAALSVVAFAGFLLFWIQRSQKPFLHLAIFSVLIALRAVVTGEYVLVKIIPDIPFDLLIRLEYWTAYLPLPSAVLFFATYFPGLWKPWVRRFLTLPSLVFACLPLFLPLDWLTRSIPWYYPIASVTLAAVLFSVGRKILKDRRERLLLAGIILLALGGVADMTSAALFARTGNLLPWAMGLLVLIQSVTLGRRFLRTFEKTRSLLDEKQLLIREVHHRVKNSLQVVASLVSLQGHRFEDTNLKAIFQALRKRITAIALVHEKLYGQVGGHPDLGSYLLELIRLQYPADSLETQPIVWDLQADSFKAEVDFCVDAGIIVTELVSNAHRHGRLPEGGGRLAVIIRIVDDQVSIEVTDNGPGFPPEFRPEDSGGLGLKLVQALLQRNDGTLEWGPGGRAVVRLRLPLIPG